MIGGPLACARLEPRRLPRSAEWGFSSLTTANALQPTLSKTAFASRLRSRDYWEYLCVDKDSRSLTRAESCYAVAIQQPTRKCRRVTCEHDAAAVMMNIRRGLKKSC